MGFSTFAYLSLIMLDLRYIEGLGPSEVAGYDFGLDHTLAFS